MENKKATIVTGVLTDDIMTPEETEAAFEAATAPEDRPEQTSKPEEEKEEK